MLFDCPDGTEMQFPTIIPTSHGRIVGGNCLVLPMTPAAGPCVPFRTDLKNSMGRIPQQQQSADHRFLIFFCCTDHALEEIRVKNRIIVDH